MIQSLLDTVKEQAVFLKSLPDEETLSTKHPSSDWTAAQCIQHMNLATELYLDQIEPKLSGLKLADKPYKPTYLAEKFIQGLGPDKKNRIKYKMKTLKVFEPGQVDPNIAVNRLNNNLDRMKSIINQCEGKDMRSFKVNTAFGSLLKFYIGDALRFVAAHNSRHFLQLKRILDSVTSTSVPS